MSERVMEINDEDMIRWTRVINGTLWLFDGYHEWTDSFGQFHPGWMTASKYLPVLEDWDTMRKWTIR